MDHAVEFGDSPVSPMSLWIVLTRRGYSDCFELNGENGRTIVIGSAETANVRITGSRAAPIECYLEREGEEVWIIPGCRASGTRLDSISVLQPTRLWRRCTLEVAGVAFAVRVREEPPTVPDNGVVKPTDLEAGQGEGAAVEWQAAVERQPCAAPDAVALDALCDQPVRSPCNRSEEARTVEPSPLELRATEQAPMSTRPTVVSVRSRAAPMPARSQLEKLGMLSIRHPFSTALAVLLGASVMSVAMRVGVELIGAASDRWQAHHTPRTAAPLPKLPLLCADMSRDYRTRSGSLREVCSWVLVTRTDTWLRERRPFDTAHRQRDVESLGSPEH